MGSVCIVRKKLKPSQQPREGDDRLYAMKTILTNRVTRAMIQEMNNEIAMLRTLDHPNIIQLREVYRQKNNMQLVMGLCRGGSLSGKVFPEPRAAIIMRQILRALAYMHERNI